MKLHWPGFNEKKTVINPLRRSSFDVSDHPVIVQGEQFKPKDELHITLVGKRRGGLLQEKIATYPEIEMQLEQVFQSIDGSFKMIGPVRILARNKKKANRQGTLIAVTQKSIILQLTMPGMATFYNYLRSQSFIDSAYPGPPPHVTLYTRNCPSGIGVSSVGMLDDLSEEILSLSELKDLCLTH